MTKLKEIRRQRGLTQVQLSELSGVSKISIVRYESGTVTPGGKNLMKLSTVLQCPAEELIKKAG